VRSIVELLRGRPSYEFLIGAHWRARQQPEGALNPLDTGAGLIWLGPILPMTGAAVHEVNDTGARVMRHHGFEYQVTFSFTNARALCAIMSISFDHASSQESERARRCEIELFEKLMEQGYVPYRGSPRIQQ